MADVEERTYYSNIRKFNNTIDRDSYINLNYSSNYPYICYIGNNNINPVGSVKIDTSGLAYFTHGNIEQDIFFYENFKPKVELFDLMVCNSEGSVEITTRNNLYKNDRVIGICVIPEGLVDNNPRFVSLENKIEEQDLCFGYFDGSLCSEYNDLTDHLLDASHNTTPFVFSRIADNPTSMYFCVEDGISYLYSLTNINISNENYNIYNVIPIINESTTDLELHEDTQRVVQYTAIMTSDNILTGTSSAYLDSGFGCISNFYHTDEIYSNYAQPSWKLNGSLNLNSTIGFYHDETNNDYPSFLNPLSQFDGDEKTLNAIISLTYNNYFVKTELIQYNLITNFTNNNVFTDIIRIDVTDQGLEKWYNNSIGNRIDIEKGSLYIPSLGEFSFLMSRLKEINNLILEYDGKIIEDSSIYMTSSECSYTGVYAVWPFNGSILNVSKSQTLKIKPFIRLKKYKKRKPENIGHI